ncbi:MAG: transcriptional regulator [Methanophagales archaeon ANME-1-THS]|nr:MAG: transcriptional regulator [Methanophagales archaeon ANME-1-THS]
MNEGDHQSKSREQRSKLDIMADILFVARNGANKTEIVYKANLNFTRVRNYLTYLETRGLLERSGPVYQSTAKGKEFLREYQQMKKILLPEQIKMVRP